MALPLPEPHPQDENDETFKRLRADILVGYEQAKAGLGVSAEEMREMFGIKKKPQP
jgi:hypothetical protein